MNGSPMDIQTYDHDVAATVIVGLFTCQFGAVPEGERVNAVDDEVDQAHGAAFIRRLLDPVGLRVVQERLIPKKRRPRSERWLWKVKIVPTNKVELQRVCPRMLGYLFTSLS